jgi:trigger factor
MAVKEQAGDEVLAENENVEYELVEIDEDNPSPDLSTPLIGMSAGDEKEFTVTYPETVEDDRYAGKEVTVSVKVYSVKETELYPLDDDFAQTVGDFDTLQELKENLTEDIRQRKERQSDNELGQEALQQLIESAERVEWPKALEDEEIDQALSEQDRRLQQSGLNLETYLVMQKKTREQLGEEFRPAVQDKVRRSLVLGKMIELEDLSIAGHEVTGQIDRLSMLAGEQGAELRQALSAPDSMRHIANDLLTSKAMDRLVQIVKGEGEKIEAQTETEAHTENAAATDDTQTDE